MTEEESAALLPDVPGWNHKQYLLEREWKFGSFKDAIVFVNKVADLADSEGHHPNIHISGRKVRLELWTHAIGGLSKNDFILAAKVNQLCK